MPKPVRIISANDTFGGLLALARVLAGEEAVFVSQAEVNGFRAPVLDLADSVADHIALIVETSGSTGTPKRIQVSTSALLASARFSAEYLQAGNGQQAQWLLALPINYIAGLQVLVRSLVAETQPVMMNTSLAFTAEAFVRAASQMSGERRFTSLVPTQLARLYAAAKLDPQVLKALQRFDAILLGGQAPDLNVVEELRGQGVKIVITYGMTETCGGCVYDGKTIGDTMVRIGENGTVQISGSVLAEGLELIDGKWFATNDLGELETDSDSKPLLKIIGRSDRVIISGGLKVSLDVVEQVVRTIAGVYEAAAISLKNEEWGQRVAVIYSGSPEVADFIAAEVFQTLGPAAKPVRVVRVDLVPKLTSGKPDYQTISSIFSQLKEGDQLG
jgi:O-succinylbenzoic acid--CoA ligase